MLPLSRASQPLRSLVPRLAWTLCALLLTVAVPAVAQDDVDSIFGDLGTSETVDEREASLPLAEGEGALRGRVFDGQAGVPISGVTVIVSWPEKDGDSRQDVQQTDVAGEFEFRLPEGEYTVRFVKAGYRASTMTATPVTAGEVSERDFPMPPLPSEGGDQVLDLEAFVVEAATVDEMMNALELRLDSDLQLNIMSAEDFSKFASSDVADALKRVAGVNVVEGQFAIIRGLEDRYSSTLYNNAVVPSPDPDRQSVQLDLFPTEVVTNLVVAKTFGPELPSNSSGGSLDILSHDYPEGVFEFKMKGAAGFNERSIDLFSEFQRGNAAGSITDGADVLGPEGGFLAGGRTQLFGREVRYKGVFNWELGFDTEQGFQETREPLRSTFIGENTSLEAVTRSGDLAFGELNLSGGRFDLTNSQRSEQTTYYGALGFDLDTEGNHRIDLSTFYTEKNQETVQLRDNGFLPNFDYSTIPDPFDLSPVTFLDSAIPGSFIDSVRERPDDPIARDGPLYFSYFADSRTFLRERDLMIVQGNGHHEFDLLDGFKFDWAANYATTNQLDDSRRLQYFFEPTCANATPPPPGCVPTQFPVTLGSIDSGVFGMQDRAIALTNQIEEEQFFLRGDGEQKVQFTEWLGFTFSGGAWYENAERDVESSNLNPPFGEIAFFGPSPQSLSDQIFGASTLGSTITNNATREIWAVTGHGKFTLFDRVDLLGGVRYEDILIQSNNDPFTGGVDGVGVDQIQPGRYLLFDARDNPTRAIESPTAPAFTVFNYQLLGLNLPVDNSTTACNKLDLQTFETDTRGCVDVDNALLRQLLNGEIAERKILPSVGFAVRPLQGVTLRGAWSRTVARPSFRELGYYVSAEPASDDNIIGNPQLTVSDVESFDLRIEYVHDSGDLIAVSGFYKDIDRPIESIILRNPADFTISTNAQFRTFFNNPNPATLWGIEAEARKHLGFIPLPLAEHFTIGGNFTWIEAEVGRSEGERARSDAFFPTCDTTDVPFGFLCSRTSDGAINSALASKRRLFGQPEWIANADISFDHPDWGTQVTLAFFAISDVLDTAGGPTFITPDGLVQRYTLDRYVDSFHTLDLIMSQSWSPSFMPGTFGFKFRIKNLTDSRRQIIYDPDVTAGTIVERSTRVGRDYKFTLTYTY